MKAIAVEAGTPVDVTQVTSRLDFGDIPQGEQATKTVVLENTGDNDHSIRILMIGSIGQMIDIEPGNSFELKAGTSRYLRLFPNSGQAVSTQIIHKLL